MKTIVMGSDEFILYIRKQYPKCETTTKFLGRQIADFMISKGFYNPDEENGKLNAKNEQYCYWKKGENTDDFIGEKFLPEKANQYVFDRALLPELYDFLDELGEK